MNDNKMILVGIEEKKGEFESKPYHNYGFHFTEEFSKPNAIGQGTGILKVKAENLNDVLGFAPTTADLVACVGKKMIVAYNRYGHPIRIGFEDTKSK